MSPRILPQHEQHYPDHIMPTRLQEYVFDDGRPPTLNRKLGAQPVTVSQILAAATAARDDAKLSNIGLEYYVGTAMHEAGCTNEWDTEKATASSPRGFVSVGLYQIGEDEAKAWGFTLEDMLDLYKSSLCFVKMAEQHRTAIRQLLRLGSSQPDPAFTGADGVVYEGGMVRAYLALYHNMGGGACAATLSRYGADWAGFMARNPTNNLVAHHYGIDCITGGPEYLHYLANGTKTPMPVVWRRDLKLTDPHMTGADVAWVQRRLQTKMPTVQIHDDGDFGPITQQVLQSLQVDLGMPPTGVVTEEVWDKLA